MATALKGYFFVGAAAICCEVSGGSVVEVFLVPPRLYRRCGGWFQAHKQHARPMRTRIFEPHSAAITRRGEKFVPPLLLVETWTPWLP